LRLPVIDCAPSIAPCNRVTGAVEVRVLWITEAGEGLVTAPESMEGWEGVDSWSAEGAADERWDSFRTHFNLQNPDGSAATLRKKTIYFTPDCTPHIPDGASGGANYGILANIPRLVK